MNTPASVAAEPPTSSVTEGASSPVTPQARQKKVIRPAREKHRVAARLEYGLFLGLFAFFRLLPFRIAFHIGEGLGWLLYHCDRGHRRIGLINLALAFPHKSEAEHREILRQSCLNLGRLLAECCFFHTMTPENVAERVRFDDFAGWQYLVEQCRPTGALIFSGHFGNWELLSHAHACYGIPVHIIHRRLRNPLIDNVLTRERERCGNKVIKKTTAGIEVLRAIRKKAVIVTAIDQNASGRISTFVPFFNHLAATSTGMAGLALVSKVPVIPVFIIRQRGTWQHRIVLLPPVEVVRTGNQEENLQATTAKFTEILQQMIEQYPDQWLWIHRRWKRRPEGEAPIY